MFGHEYLKYHTEYNIIMMFLARQQRLVTAGKTILQVAVLKNALKFEKELFDLLTAMYSLLKLYCSFKCTIGEVPTDVQTFVGVAINVPDICMPTALAFFLSLAFI